MIFDFISQLFGAFIIWIIKGFRGKLTDEMATPDDIDSIKSIRNYIISIIVTIIIYVIYSNS